MSPVEGYLPKMAAIAFIGVQSGFGRPTVERTIQRLQDEGRIKPTKVANVLLFSPADMELVVKVLKGEA
ncbi:MAG TPA: hypothetical protein VKB76_17755 [Ktedonobacterales bacterium]|nr:hypothetical protein [Ktedonobacterales bacterium]